MIRDVFYYGKKPNVHPREKFAVDLNDAREQASTEHFWIINEYCDYRNFDWDFEFDYLPDDEVWTQHHNNVWPSIHQKDSGTWLCPKEHSDITVYRADVDPLKRRMIEDGRWIIPDNIDKEKFDFTWHHDPTEPPFIYQFGTQWQRTGGPKYIVPGATDLKFVGNIVATNLPNKTNWDIPTDIDTSLFDFSWHPDELDGNFIYEFGVGEQQTGGPKYVMPGATQIKYVGASSKVKAALDLFFIDRGNIEADNRFKKLQELFGDRISRTRYLNSWVDTINRCVNKSRTSLFWVVDSNLDYTHFDFTYYPNTWQMNMVHVFGTQWSHWGTTFLVNKDTFPNDTKYIKIIEHLSNLNFVKQSKAIASNCIYDVFLIDHGNKETPKVHQDLIQKTNKSVMLVYYNRNYLETFKNILSMIPDKKDNYIWITNSICDYELFDFTYICDPFARDQLHVFPSDKQKYGDTFLVNVTKLRELIDTMITLSDYPKINFNNHLRTNRLRAPVVVTGETHVTSFINDFNFPYAVFKTQDNQDLDIIDQEPMSLWQDDHKAIKICSTGATQIVAPREVRYHLKKELYDYPYIVKSPQLKKSRDMDVVFMSNHETRVEERYQKLAEALGREPKRVNGVKGRENAIRKCAEISDTDWVLVVPGKLEINKRFDFSWQPDRMQEAKHYIFYATNPLNKLCYGHMAPVMYNKRLVLETLEYGLDFTMSKKHEIVPINTGIAHYNLDPLMTWRTAFREALKLKHAGDAESLERLDIWLNVAHGLNAEYSIAGAKKAIQYYHEVEGDEEKLQLSFDWDWLLEKFNISPLF